MATVSANGLVTAASKGNCTIYCSATDGSGVKAECQVTVTSGNDSEEFIPKAIGVWTFDNASNLMAGMGIATLQGAVHTKGNVTVTDNLADAAITAVPGPQMVMALYLSLWVPAC